MTDLDAMPFGQAAGEVVVVTPKKCRRHEWGATFVVDQATGKLLEQPRRCSRCGSVRDEEAARRGRNNRSRGKAAERREMRLAGVHTGNANKADDGLSVDGMFAFQAKQRATATFPGWQAAELDKLRFAHAGKVPVLVVVEAPGRGRKPRKLAVLEWADWLALHGPTGGME